jgi:acetyltransferase-like isoleucine patch superfamily enzyme
MVLPNSFLSEEELSRIGFKHLGDDIKISRNAVFYGAEFISIGDKSRIDDFSVVTASGTGEVHIGKFVHLGANVSLFGNFGIKLGDYSGIAPGTRLFSESDDFSGDFLTNPTVDINLRNVKSGLIELEQHSIIGSNCVVLPGVLVGEGAAVGAMSLVNNSLDKWSIYSGVPAKKLKNRSRGLLDLKLQQSNP